MPYQSANEGGNAHKKEKQTRQFERIACRLNRSEPLPAVAAYQANKDGGEGYDGFADAQPVQADIWLKIAGRYYFHLITFRTAASSAVVISSR